MKLRIDSKERKEEERKVAREVVAVAVAVDMGFWFRAVPEKKGTHTPGLDSGTELDLGGEECVPAS